LFNFRFTIKADEIMYVGDDALNDVAPARAMGMVSVWFKQEDAEIELTKTYSFRC
jgi:putative hydrolase of the HAD superfamily